MLSEPQCKVSRTDWNKCFSNRELENTTRKPWYLMASGDEEDNVVTQELDPNMKYQCCISYFKINHVLYFHLYRHPSFQGQLPCTTLFGSRWKQWPLHLLLWSWLLFVHLCGVKSQFNWLSVLYVLLVVVAVVVAVVEPPKCKLSPLRFPGTLSLHMSDSEEAYRDFAEEHGEVAEPSGLVLACSTKSSWKMTSRSGKRIRKQILKKQGARRRRLAYQLHPRQRLATLTLLRYQFIIKDGSTGRRSAPDSGPERLQGHRRTWLKCQCK